MELDPRIIEGKTYLDCFDTEVAKEFISKECYLSDSVASFANVDKLNKATLREVNDGDMYPYKLENIRWHYGSLFILPCEWVEENKEPEKKYRPYTLKEFVSYYSLGDVIVMRPKVDTSSIRHKLFIEYVENDTGLVICLGGFYYSFNDLFKDFEIRTNEGWKPFGIKE